MPNTTVVSQLAIKIVKSLSRRYGNLLEPNCKAVNRVCAGGVKKTKKCKFLASQVRRECG